LFALVYLIIKSPTVVFLSLEHGNRTLFFSQRRTIPDVGCRAKDTVD